MGKYKWLWDLIETFCGEPHKTRKSEHSQWCTELEKTGSGVLQTLESPEAATLLNRVRNSNIGNATKPCIIRLLEIKRQSPALQRVHSLIHELIDYYTVLI